MIIHLVVSNPQFWPLDIPGVEIVSAKTYLTDPKYSSQRNAKVINLCRSYRYQTSGYYVSLLAHARGHKPLPSVQTIQDMKSPTITRFVSSELEETIQNSLQHVEGTKISLSIYFGKCISSGYDKLAYGLFQQFQAPLFQAQFAKTQGKWTLQNISPINPNELPQGHHEAVILMAKEYFTKKRVHFKKKLNLRFDLAILYNPDDPTAPSGKKAIQRFSKAAQDVGFNVELITKDDYSRIAEFDSLFIRETTNVNHHTYRLARRALAEGLVVVDDPDSILKCTNKVYVAELLERHKVPAPRTLIIHSDNIEKVGRELGFPCVIKIPDGSCSNGVVKAGDEKELQTIFPTLLEKSDLLIAQEFIPTAFDWRICIFDRKPLFACKYYMSRKHWQIRERASSGKMYWGKVEAIPVSHAPRKIVRAAIKAANLIGSGLYGVDVKECNGNPYVIEINDNPSIEVGDEDTVLKDELYERIMDGLVSRVERLKNGV